MALKDLVLLDVARVARLLDLSTGQVHRLIKKGLPAIQMQKRGRLRFDRADVLAWAKKQGKEA